MENHLWLILVLVGLMTVLSMLVRRLLQGLSIPPLIGYLSIGIALAIVHHRVPFLGTNALHVFEFLGAIGIFCLLFRVGLESKIGALLAELGHAIWIWIGNVGVSGCAGFSVLYYGLGFGLVPSLFVAVALTATSLGVCLETWREAGALDTPAGRLLIDVAELDDVSGVVLMMLLFAVAPLLVSGHGGLLSLLFDTLAGLVAKALLFGLFCVLFARYVERHITGFFRRLEPAPNPMLLVVGIAVIIAASADGLGFSLPIGALFAGLVFSRDPEAVKVDLSFESLYALFTPFFFIWIGLTLAPQFLGGALGLSLLIFLVALLGKVVGTAVPAWPVIGGVNAVILGVSMVPRAEIAMIIVSEGRRLGNWAMPPELYSAMILVTAATCVLAPIVSGVLLRRQTGLHRL
jgi:Kef-type K+ transport system membrane component KefB